MSELTEADARKPFCEAVARLGYRAELPEDSPTVIRTAMSGLACLLTIGIGGRFTLGKLYCGFAVDEDSPADLETINTFNRKYRFGKLTLDDDMDYALEMDFLVDAKKEDIQSYMDTVLMLWEGLLGEFKSQFLGSLGSSISASQETNG